MPLNCFVPLCDSGTRVANLRFDSEKESRPTLFRAPKNQDLFIKWSKAIPRTDKQLGPKDHVCSLHFSNDDMVTAYITKLKDGSTFVMPKLRPQLKKDSVPTIFDAPKHLSKKGRKRKELSSSIPPTPTKKKKKKLECSLKENEENEARRNRKGQNENTAVDESMQLEDQDKYIDVEQEMFNYTKRQKSYYIRPPETTWEEQSDRGTLREIGGGVSRGTASLSELNPQIVNIKSEAPWDSNSSTGRFSPEWSIENDDMEPSSGYLSQEVDPLAQDPHYNRDILQEIKEQLCRICGTKRDSLSPIFSDDYPVEEDSLTLAKKIEMYLPLQINPDGELPPNICLTCQNLLESWHKLHVSCLAADSVLRNIFATNGSKCVPEDTFVEPEAESESERPAMETVTMKGNVDDPEPHLLSPEDRSCGLNGPLSKKHETSLPILIWKLHKCRFCGERFSTRMESLTHQKPCGMEPVICHVCGRQISQRSQLNSHIRKVHAPKSFECKMCPKKFRSNSRLQVHKRNMHSGPKEFCEPCCRAFRSVMRHIITHKAEIDTGLSFKVSTYEEGGDIICVCPVCLKKFPSKLSLIIHMNATIKKRCTRCMKLIPNERFALIHKCKPWLCRHCGIMCNSRLRLDDHELSHSEEISFTCKTCEVKFSSHTDMVSHFRESEGHSDPPCDSSLFDAIGKQAMDFLTDDVKKVSKAINKSIEKGCHIANDHQYVIKSGNESRKAGKFNSIGKSTKTISYKCKHCSETFPVKQDCVQHVKQCGLEPAFCDVCGKTISKRYLLKPHLRTHNHKKQKRFECEECGKKFVSKCILQCHISARHKKEAKEFCEPCCKIFYSRKGYVNHVKKHTDGKAKSLNMKLESVQNGSEVSYLCPVCGECFPDKMSLIIHLHVIKKKRCVTCRDVLRCERNDLTHKCGTFFCRYCGRGFTKRPNMYIHERIHKSRTFTCKTCGNKYSSSTSLQRHYAVHKPPSFHCEQCGKQFRWKEGYLLHRQIHEGVRHICPLCDKAFKLKGSLQLHCRKMHPSQNPFLKVAELH